MLKAGARKRFRPFVMISLSRPTQGSALLLSLEPQTGPPQVNLISRTELFAAPVAGRHFQGTAFAENARAEFAAIITNAVFVVVQPDVGVAARYGGIGFVGAF